MADGGRQDVLGQKAQAAQRAFEARGMSPSKALRRALSRTADVLWDLALVTHNVTIDMRDQDGVIDGLGPSDLLILLDGPDGALGLAALDRSVMTGLVEVQTIQQVTTLPVEDDRILTQTDAAMMAPLLDGTLDRMVGCLADHPLRPQLEGFRFGAMVEDSRAVGLLLEAAAYRVFRADVDLALGRRQGTMSIILPDRKLRKGALRRKDDPDDPGPHADVMGRVPARLDAILTRIRIPLSKAGSLKVGDMLPLAPDALDKVEVLAGPRHVAARGRLGQINGLRAVRLNWPPVANSVARPSAAQHTDPDDVEFAAPTDSFDDGGVDEPETPPVEMDFDTGDTSEELPDLPPLDFQSDVEDFDIGSFGDDEAAAMDDLPDIGGDFGSASIDLDLDE